MNTDTPSHIGYTAQTTNILTLSECFTISETRENVSRYFKHKEHSNNSLCQIVFALLYLNVSCLIMILFLSLLCFCMIYIYDVYELLGIYDMLNMFNFMLTVFISDKVRCNKTRQWIRVVIQRYNAASILWTFPTGNDLEIFTYRFWYFFRFIYYLVFILNV